MQKIVVTTNNMQLELEVQFSGSKVRVPIYKNFSGTDMVALTADCERNEFEADLQSLFPRVINEDFADELLLRLVATMKSHVERFGRLLDFDCETYVGITMIIFCAILNALNLEGLTDEYKIKMFSWFKSHSMFILKEAM